MAFKIPKHHLQENMIIKTEEELQETTSKIDEPFQILEVYDIFLQESCGYYILLQSQAFEMMGRLISENNRLRQMNKGIKLNNSKLTLERNELLKELTEIKNMSMFEFGNKYCNSESLEEAGHMLAKDLLGR